MKNGSQHAIKPPTTILRVCAVFVSRFKDDILIGTRLPWMRKRLLLLVEQHDSEMDISLCVNWTIVNGFIWWLPPVVDVPVAVGVFDKVVVRYLWLCDFGLRDEFDLEVFSKSYVVDERWLFVEFISVPFIIYPLWGLWLGFVSTSDISKFSPSVS